MICDICQNTTVEASNNYFYCEKCGIYKIKNTKEYSSENSSWGHKDEIVRNYLSGIDWRKKVFTNRINLIKLLHPNIESILDIGSATGLFASMIEDSNIQVDVVEPYYPFKKYSIATNQKIKHFDDIYEINQKYDFITIFDTFGYTKDLSKTMTKLSSLLNPNGYLMITAGWVDDKMKSVHDFSFNYYFESNFWEETFPKNTNLQLLRFWTENKNFNTKKYGTQEWWNDYLMLTNEIKMNYIIYKR